MEPALRVLCALSLQPIACRIGRLSQHCHLGPTDSRAEASIFGTIYFGFRFWVDWRPSVRVKMPPKHPKKKSTPESEEGALEAALKSSKENSASWTNAVIAAAVAVAVVGFGLSQADFFGRSSGASKFAANGDPLCDCGMEAVCTAISAGAGSVKEGEIWSAPRAAGTKSPIGIFMLYRSTFSHGAAEVQKAGPPTADLCLIFSLLYLSQRRDRRVRHPHGDDERRLRRAPRVGGPCHWQPMRRPISRPHPPIHPPPGMTSCSARRL